MALTGCIECGRQISDSAESCPGCGTKEPRGVECKLCKRQMRRSDGSTCERTEFMSPSSGHSTWKETAHRECIERYFTPPASLVCPDCGLRLAGINDSFTALGLWTRGKHGSACPGCGARDVFAGQSTEMVHRCCGARFYPFQGAFPGGHGHPLEVAAAAQKKGGCFIATAALEGGHAEQLAVLYDLRDRFLMTSSPGRVGVRLYYRLSPGLAIRLEHSRLGRVIVRRCLVLPVAKVLRIWLARGRAE